MNLTFPISYGFIDTNTLIPSIQNAISDPSYLQSVSFDGSTLTIALDDATPVNDQNIVTTIITHYDPVTFLVSFSGNQSPINQPIRDQEITITTQVYRDDFAPVALVFTGGGNTYTKPQTYTDKMATYMVSASDPLLLTIQLDNLARNIQVVHLYIK